jgi:heme/copper-type cytochrome/quinol oxidase subunit 3
VAASFRDAEPVETVERNLSVGIRIWAGATTFAFLGPFFAFFYLRSLNTADLWRPAHVDPSQGLGAAIVTLTVLSSVALLLAARRPEERMWKALVALSLVLGFAAVALQCVEYTELGFGPMDGGYASVFLAWTGLTAVFSLATMLWLETLLAWGLRDPTVALPAVAPRLAALAFYWTYFTILAVIMWVVLYLV